ncbi:hypothetical protein SDC9_209176 [bioreactor metagenome]|uniref:Uncharacterized protein n=1 Tax=bioreactor metagenome TaxID=1076179 RepID=A0A645JFJ2_9ZZZZ
MATPVPARPNMAISLPPSPMAMVSESVISRRSAIASMPAALSMPVRVMSVKAGCQRVDIQPGSCGMMLDSCPGVISGVSCKMGWFKKPATGTSSCMVFTFSIFLKMLSKRSSALCTMISVLLTTMHEKASSSDN